MLKKDIIFFLLSIAFVSCQDESGQNGVGNVDLSLDDKMLVFSGYIDNVSSIYKSDLKGQNIDIISSPDNDSASYESPKFSSDGTKILFLEFHKKSNACNIIVTSSNGKQKKQVTSEPQLITSAIFSLDGSGIYYSKANEYRNYSPVGKLAPHVFDIYYFNLKTFKEVKLTNLRAYDINSLSLYSGGDSLMFKLVQNNSKIGIYAIPLTEPNAMSSLNPINTPRGPGGEDMYNEPSFSQKYNVIAFTAPYEVYKMDYKTRIAKLVIRPKVGDVRNLQLFHTQRKMLFINSEVIHTVDYDGNEIEKISINIPSN
jgi:Tol biopolymer transport system component